MTSVNNPERLAVEIAQTPVVVLCGGAATRMADVTHGDTPKHLLNVGGQTVLERAIEPFMAAGQIVLATGIHGDKIQNFVSDRYSQDKVVCSPEDRPLGVIGALSQAVVRFNITGQFMIVHGDEITPDLDLADMYASHQAAGADLTVLTTAKVPAVKDFAFRVDSDGRALGFDREEVAKADPLASNFGIGTFVCEQSALPTMGKHEAWGAFLQDMIAERRLHAYTSQVTFQNINRPADLAALTA